MLIAIPVIQVVSNSKKEAQFESTTLAIYDIDSFKMAGIFDLTIFACILLELFFASILFYCLSKKYDIKFQIQ